MRCDPVTRAHEQQDTEGQHQPRGQQDHDGARCARDTPVTDSTALVAISRPG